jgi:hypothetical protein
MVLTTGGFMDNQKNTPTRGVKEFVKAEVAKFWNDPLLYAFERWVGAFILALAISILASAVKMVISAGTSVAN